MSETDPRAYIQAGRRLAVKESEWLDDWWVGTSPRNGDHAAVEGNWSEWVSLAHAILAADRAYRGVERSPDEVDDA